MYRTTYAPCPLSDLAGAAGWVGPPDPHGGAGKSPIQVRTHPASLQGNFSRTLRLQFAAWWFARAEEDHFASYAERPRAPRNARRSPR
jgi:hypothetical protein